MSSITFNNGSMNYRGYTLNNFNFGFVDARYQQQNPSNEALPSSSPTETNPYGYSFTGASKYISLDNFSGITGENIGPAFLITKDPNDTSTALKVSALNTGDASRSLIAIGGTTDDSFTGSAADDLFVGGGGYDMFVGNGGSDVYVLGAGEGFGHIKNPTLTSKIVCKTVPDTYIEGLNGGFAYTILEKGSSKKIAELSFDPESFIKFCANAGITLTETNPGEGTTYFNYLNSAIVNQPAIHEALRSMLYVLSDDGSTKSVKHPSFRPPPPLDEREGVLALLSKNEGPLGGLATVSGLKKSYLDEESKIAYASLKATGNAGGSFVVNDLTDTTGYRIVGSSRGDTITTGAGNDYIWGDAGNDTISGGDGHDYIAGGLGKNNLTGGGGNDTFVIDASGGRGRTYVTDFSEGDRIVLQNAGNLVYRYRNNERNSGFIEIMSSGRAVATIRTGLSLDEFKPLVQE